MRHATRSQRLSRPSDQREALLENLVKSLVRHGSIQTTHARAKEAQRVADRLVSFGKEGSVHARRRAFRVLQDRDLVKQLFGEIAPRFGDCPGGYTRVVRLPVRRGDGAERALLAFSRLPAEPPPLTAPKAKTTPPPKSPSSPTPPAAPYQDTGKRKPKQLFEGLRSLWTRKRGRSAA